MPKKTETRETLLLEIQRLQKEIDPNTTLSAAKQWTGQIISGRRLEQLCDALWNVYAEDAKPSPYCMEDGDFVEIFVKGQFIGDDDTILPLGEIKQALQDMLKLLQRGNATHVALICAQPSKLVWLVDTPVAALKRIRNDLVERERQIKEAESAQTTEEQRRRQEEQLLELARTMGIEKAIQTLQENNVKAQ